MDGAEALPAFQLDAPPGSDPKPVLLVVHRHDPLGPSALGEEGVEAVEGADVEHAHPGEVPGKHGYSVTVVPREAGRVDALSAVEREGMEPKGHPLDRGASEARVDLDWQQVGHVPLSLRDDEPVRGAAPCRLSH